ncbi:Six-bladed beta-propeller, TolB-like [Phytophthora cactorum]|nr:Six-bladed beta-propeller, TolB-like [Phytophthora cactorum]
MDEFWGSVKDEAVPSKSQRQSRPSLEHRKQAKKPRVGPSSTSHAEERMDSKSLMSIAPAPAPVSLAVAAPVVAPVSTSIANPVQTKGPASKTASSSPVEAGTCTGVAVSTRAQLEDVALQTIARPKDPSVESAGLSKLGNLIDDRFAKVLECQGKQLKLAEEQNQLLARILATLQRNQHHDHTDGRAVKSANATDGSDVEVVVGALARVVWVGTYFGQTQADVQMLTVKGTRCDSIISWSPERVECIVGLPLRFSQTQLPFVSEDDCSIQINHGSMTGIALNYNEMFASGTSSPIVERIDIYANFVLPHALAIDDREGEDWLYWSNSEDGAIYRSSLRSNVIEVLQRRCWSVRGLALNIFHDAGKERVSLMYSLESKGTISQIELPSSNTSITSPSLAQVLLSGLRSPRGLAMDSTNQILFFTRRLVGFSRCVLARP